MALPGSILCRRSLEKARSGLRYMGTTAVSALPSSGVRSNLKSGIVRGGGPMSAHRSTPVNRHELGELPGLTLNGTVSLISREREFALIRPAR